MLLLAFTSSTTLLPSHHPTSIIPAISSVPPLTRPTAPVSLFRFNSNKPKPLNHPTTKVRVLIEAPARNKRRVCANNLISAPLDIVWDFLSDYGHLSDFIPNLKISDVLAHPRGGIRVEQCGAQSVLGFEFRASLIMDMVEVNERSSEWRAIEFGLVESRDFNEFEGVWRMRDVDGKTALYYEVNIVPRGLIPVRAIEWRISEDVPENMDAVRLECERRRRIAVADGRRRDIARVKRGQS